jgi:hypothetical protein
MGTRPKRAILGLGMLLLVLSLPPSATSARAVSTAPELPAITGLYSPTNDVAGWSHHNKPLFICRPDPRGIAQRRTR